MYNREENRREGEYVSSLMCHMDVMLALSDYFNIV